MPPSPAAGFRRSFKPSARILDMAVASFQFLAFGMIVILLYNLHPRVAWRKWILLLANFAFLATFFQGTLAFIPLATYLAFGYVGVALIQRWRSKLNFWLIVVVNLLLFCWLKKYSFLPQESFLRFAYSTLGLSYIFFRVMHMLIDAHENALNSPVDLPSYLNFTLNFTTLVAGPIQRFPEFMEQHLAPTPSPLTLTEIGISLERIIVGFFKVKVLGLIFFSLHTQALTALSVGQSIGLRGLAAATAIASYAIYLYSNFSGYTDIVIGTARFLRIRLPENFNRPFSAGNFLDFWNRWHITLSQWFKAYVYNPFLIALMRRYPSDNVAPFLGVGAFFVTFFLVGLWHGQTSEFVFFGILLGLGVSLNKLFQVEMTNLLGPQRYKMWRNNWTYQAICRGLTFTFFSFTLLWFWSNWKELSRMSRGLQWQGQLLTCSLVFVASTILLAVWEFARASVLNIKWAGQPFVLSRYVRTVWGTGLVFVLVIVMEILSTPAPDIVYKSF